MNVDVNVISPLIFAHFLHGVEICAAAKKSVISDELSETVATRMTDFSTENAAGDNLNG